MMLAAGYVCAGVLFALVFLSVGVQRLDPAARDSGIGFKVLVFPGCVALWPWLVLKWLRGEVVK